SARERGLVTITTEPSGCASASAWICGRCHTMSPTPGNGWMTATLPSAALPPTRAASAIHLLRPCQQRLGGFLRHLHRHPVHQPVSRNGAAVHGGDQFAPA